jgi:hypothetical protein
VPSVVKRTTFGAAVGCALLILFLVVDALDASANSATLGVQGGVDYQLYMGAATAWLHGGRFFEPYQLAGPYQISAGDILYPPVSLILFVPFTFLPAILWWLIPGAAVAWCLYCLRPAQWAWPLLAASVAWPTTLLKILTGNPVIWAVAAIAMGVLYAWPSVLALIKPSLLPFALVGMRTRRWWIALGVVIVVSLPFGSLWIDWVHSVLNSQGGGIAYSSLEIPMLAFPLVAWLGRTRAADGAGTARNRSFKRRNGRSIAT